MSTTSKKKPKAAKAPKATAARKKKTAAKPKARAKKTAGTKPKKPATKTDAPKKRSKAETARENGRLGGRPKKGASLEDFDSIGPPPIGKPLALARWVQSILAVDMYRMIRGRDKAKLSNTLRQTGRTIVQSLPPDIIAEAKRLMDADAGILEGDAGPETVAADSLGEGDVEEQPTRSISG